MQFKTNKTKRKTLIWIPRLIMHAASYRQNSGQLPKQKKANKKSKGPQKIAKIKSPICIQGSAESRGVPFGSCSSLEVTTNPADRRGWIRGHWCLTHWHWLVLSGQVHWKKLRVSNTNNQKYTTSYYEDKLIKINLLLK